MLTRDTVDKHLTIVRFEFVTRTEDIEELKALMRYHIWGGEVSLFSLSESTTLHNLPSLEDSVKDELGEFFFGESYTP